MKKINIITLFTILLFSFSCVKDQEKLFPQDPDTRLSEVLDTYQKELQESTYGWIMTIETKVGGVYRLWIAFTDSYRVEMLCDMDATWNTNTVTSKLVSQSTYRLRAIQTPVLVFDTYNYLHLMADPQGTNSSYGDINGGVNGVGLASDFEFTIDSLKNGKFFLTGRYNKVKAFMSKASMKEEISIKQGALKSVHIKLSNYLADVKFPVLDIDNKLYDVKLGGRSSQVSFMNNDAVESVSVGSYLDLSDYSHDNISNSLFLIDPLKINNLVINSFLFDGEDYFVQIGSNKYYIKDNKKPSIPLNLGYNRDYTQLTIDDSRLQGSMSESFFNNIYLESRQKLFTNGRRHMQYAYIDFIMHPITFQPIMQLSIRYNNTSGSVFIARWRYKYVINEDKTITFLEREQTGSSNERLQEQYLKSFVDYFCELEYESYSTSSWNNTIISNTIPKTFKIDWIQNNTQGSIDMLGAFIPINDKNNYCVGILAK